LTVHDGSSSETWCEDRLAGSRDGNLAPFGVGDIDGDGADNLVVMGVAPGPQILFATRPKRLAPLPREASEAFAVGDVNGDGVDDLLVVLTDDINGDHEYLLLAGRAGSFPTRAARWTQHLLAIVPTTKTPP
jgi:hypothetical protein